MFVKVYQYNIQKEKINEYLAIQDKATEIYGRYLDFHTMYLQSKNDGTEWIEISRYKDEAEYRQGLTLINEHEEIHELFNAFQSLLVSDKRDIREESYIEKKRKCTF